MGGLVFTGGPDPLYTPRMPPAVYQHAKAACHAALQQLFEHVATPIEGPEKPDFGDLDFLVYSSTADLQSVQWRDDVRAALGAVGCVSQQPHTGSFAIYWPEGVPDERETPGVTQQRYIQVDVHVCASPETLRWSVFKNDHGDLWNLLGSTIRPFGLTVDHEALYVRIAEIEKLDKKKAKVRLTSDPDTVLRFLGLDLARWKRPFATMRETYEYAATCRFFWVKPESSSEGGADGGSDADEDRIGGEFTRKDLKSNDRQRMSKRPMFNRWINEFIPACREQHRFTDRQIDRDGTLEEAFAQFGVRETYDARVLEFRKKRQAETIWKDVIKAAVPTEGIAPMFRGGAANGLKKIILQGDESFDVVPSEPLKNEDGLFDEDAVRRFAEANWEKVGDIVFKKNHERMLEKLKKDAERKHEKEASVV
ncbi:hypothetical protein PG997_005632 [Apiospora hydei]|uniref:Uncharacterized protein n=1 Tax=Apiospora hydei TaxID=1337664 RepID=A0ABR1WLI8_9PEZI